MTENKRFLWLDFARGISMILVIVGHTVGSTTFAEEMTRNFIYSFHMPLFFIISGYTYRKPSEGVVGTKNIKKWSKALLLPVLIIFMLRIIVEIISFEQTNYLIYFIKKMIILFWGSGTSVQIFDIGIPALGMMWFLVVLFLNRVLLDYLYIKFSSKDITYIIVLFTALGYFISKFLWLPFSIDVMLSSVVFVWVGYKLRELKIRLDIKRTIYLLLIWACLTIAIYYQTTTYFELAARHYPLFPISHMNGIVGALAFIGLSKNLSKIPFSHIAVKIGQNTMSIFYIHAMDYLFEPFWKINDSIFVNSIVRVILVILISHIFVLVKQIIWKKISF